MSRCTSLWPVYCLLLVCTALAIDLPVARAQIANEPRAELDYPAQLDRAQRELAEAEQQLAELEQREPAPSERALRRAQIHVELRRQLIDLQTTLVQLAEADEQATLRRVDEFAQSLRRLFSIDAMVAAAREELAAVQTLLARLEEDESEELSGDAQEVLELRENQLQMLSRLQSVLGEPGDANRPAEAELDEDEIEDLIRGVHAQRQLLALRSEILNLLVDQHAAREAGKPFHVAQLNRRIEKLRLEAGIAEIDDGPGAGEFLPPLEISEEDLAVAASADFARDVMPLLERHCVDCHGPDTQEAQIDLTREVTIRPLVRRQDLWNKVLAHLKARVMPPEDAAEMSPRDRRQLTAYLVHEIEHFDYSEVDDPGYEAARRLTHTEYDNTIRDLFQIDLRLGEKFPTELTGTSGFDNSANTLFLHRLQMERYIGAAEAIVDHALPPHAATLGQQQSRAAVLVAQPDGQTGESEAAKQIFAHFLRRAFRRAVSQEELAAAQARFAQARQSGESFEQAVRLVVQTTLVSPKFLMRSESWQDTEAPYRVDDWDLASRLSYFLWSSMPDDELLDLAEDGRLSDPQVLRAQVDRLLADERSAALGSVFAAQWLGSQHLGVRIRPDPIDNPWCTQSLMDSLKAETALFFHSLVRDNATIAQLVDADYTFLNEEIAGHYGIEGIEGHEMRRVSLSDRNRGGIFGQGALLAITSFPGRTSPVVRGKWILSEVLGTPPPPPPPDVSDFSDEIADNRFLSPRQKLQMHRRNPACYACHSQIDPLGFSLERFDWFGRTIEHCGGKPIDDHGRLPSGTEFTGPAGLKEVVVAERLPDLVRQLSRKMLSYALSRQLEYYDEPAVRQIIERTSQDEYRFRALIYAVVESYPFRWKKNPQSQGGI